MNNIKSLILNKKIYIRVAPEGKKPRSINPLWEEADEFAKYVGLKTPFVLMLFKRYGKFKVLSQRSYLADYSGNRYATLVYLLKNAPKQQQTNLFSNVTHQDCVGQTENKRGV